MGSMCELGQRLREAREAKGLELGQAAETLRVRRVTLEALEECRFSELPEPTLARGYLKRYAQLLGIDPLPLLALYPNNLTEVPIRTYLDIPSPSRSQTAGPQTSMPSASSGNSRAWLIPLLLLLAVAVWVGVSFIRPQPVTQLPPATSAPVTPPAPQQISLKIATQPTGAKIYLDGFLLGQAPLEARVEVGDRTLRVEATGFQKYEQTLSINGDRNLSIALKANSATLPTTPSTNPSTPSTQTPANPSSPTAPTSITIDPNNSVVLSMVGRSWIRVVNATTGQELYEGIPAKGAQLSYPLPVVVRSGNAGAIQVVVNGQNRGLMGKEGQVASQRYGK